MTVKLDAKHYQKNAKLQQQLAHEVMKHHDFLGDENILDIGCGDGKVTSEMTSLISTGKVLGIDPSTEMITIARRTYDKPNLTFEIGDAETLTYQNQFTLISAFSCLHWVKDLQRAFEQIYKALKPGGKFLALTFPKESAYWKPFLKVMSTGKWAPYMSESMVPYWFTSVELKEILAEIGFKTLVFKEITALATYGTNQEFIDYVNGWLPCLTYMSAKQQNEYLENVLETVIKDFRCNSGLSIPYKRLDLYLEKPAK